MIFDRTRADVANAQKIINEKVRNTYGAGWLNDEDLRIVERGICQAGTINRIVDRIMLIFKELKFGMKWDVAIPDNPSMKHWTDGDVFSRQDEFNIINLIYDEDNPRNTIIGNLEYHGLAKNRLAVLKNKFERALSSRRDPFLSMDGLNLIEGLLVDIDTQLNPTWRIVMAVQEGDILYLYGAFDAQKEGEQLVVR